VAGDIVSGEVALIVYDGTRFQLLNGNSFTNLNVSNNLTLSGGTANGVLYLNGSKVATSGTALVFDGNNLAVGTNSTANARLFGYANDSSLPTFAIRQDGTADIQQWYAGGAVVGVFTKNAELGIGTSSPVSLLEVRGTFGTATTAATISNGSAASASNIARLDFRLVNTFGGLERSAAIWGLNPNASANNGGALVFGVSANGTATTPSEVARFDQAGNLGLGVSPSASSVKTFEIATAGNTLTGIGGGDIALMSNAYFNSGFKYAGSNLAASYRLQDGVHKWNIAASGTAGNAITFTQAMTLDASGNLGVGTTSPSAKLVVSNAGAQGFEFNPNASGLAQLEIYNRSTAAYYSFRINADDIRFHTGASAIERARITAGGFFKASNTGTYASSTNDRYEFTSDKNDLTILVNSTNTGANVNNVYSQLPAGANAGAYHFVGSISGSGLQFTVDADGDVKNTNNSYGSISDIKLKQDVVDATSQWDDIKALRVRKYRFKRNPDAALQIGLVAQEAEAVSPGLVEETADRDEEGNDLGTTTKSVKYSVLYMKTVKALQEAMTRIEQLEAKVAALESK
jgi:hypothetical protein